MSLRAEGTIRIACSSAQEAEELRTALAPENEGFVQATVDGEHLVLKLPDRPAAGTLRSLDDALACLQAARATNQASSGDAVADAEQKD